MTEASRYEVVVVGGGPGGLTTALYTTRLNHDTAIIDRGGGRAAMMQDTHNVIGIPESTGGKEFLQTAFDQLEHYGADVIQDFVRDLERTDGEFHLETAGGDAYRAETVVLATGFSDERPDPPLPRTGRGLHYCLHCDAEMFVDEPVYVMGHGDSAAKVAMIMLNFTDDVDLLLDGAEPTWSGETERQLRGHPVDVIPEAVTGVTNGDDGWLESLEFADGTEREYKGGFAMYGSDYNTGLAEGVGATITDDGTIVADDHGNTDVEGLYAVGDITPGHNQIPVAMGDGARAGIDIHYDLREYPKPVEEIEGAPEAAADD
jgi:thioredoxin reductase (NADPH)